MEKIKRLSLGCTPLNEILDGGIEYGVITNFYGEAGSGKSNVSLMATVNALKKGEKVLFIDTEGSFSVERASQIMDDFEEKSENVMLVEPDSFSEQHEEIKSIKEMEEDFGLIVVDSLVALYRLALNEDGKDGSNKMLAQQLAELSRISRKKDIPVLITTQVYSNFNGDGVELVSRDVARYWSKCLVKLEKVDKDRRKAIVTKHRSRPEGVSSQFIITGEGLEKIQGETESIL